MAEWTPAEISTELWLDAADAATISESGGAVSQWSDKSGNDRHATQGTAANKPTTGTHTQNSLNAMRFDGADDFFSIPGLSSLSQATIFIVLKADSDPAAADASSGLWTFSSGDHTHLCYPADGVFYDSFGTSTRKTTGNPTPSFAATRLYSAHSRSGDWRSFIDGVVHYSTATNTVDFSASHYLGLSYKTGSYYLKGIVCEVVIVEGSGAMPDADREIIEGYLAWKWGINANLDAGHSYYSAPPTLPGPTIDTQPSADSVTEGETASFSVTASGTGTLTYQWYETTAGAISGATSSTYAFTAALADDGNSYYCAVTDDNGTTNTDAASLAVAAIPAPLSIATHPQPLAVLVGATAEFSVVKGGGQGTVTYQWFDSVNGELSGETSATLSFTASKSQDGRLYTCAVADDVDEIFVGARLTVSRVLAITSQPGAVAANAGDVAIFTVAATGDAPISYQWHGPGGLLPGEIAPTLAIEARPAYEGDYYCAVAAGSQAVNSNTAALTVTVQAPTISSGASDVSVPVGGIASFAVSAGGYGGLAYQWYRDGVAIGGATRDSYSTQVGLDDTGAEFYCVVSDAHGNSEQSNTGTLTVLTVSVDDQTEQVVQESIGPTAAPTWRSSDWAARVRAAEGGKPFYVDDYRFSGKRAFRHRDQLEHPREE